MVKRNEKQINNFFKEIQRDVEHVAGVVAKSYAKEATLRVAEEWADVLIYNFLSGSTVKPLAKSTIYNKRSRKAPYVETPLMETGFLLQSIEFRYTRVPHRNYDVLQVGVFDDSTPHGHGQKKLTPKQLMMIHEYGNSNIPARPILTKSAEDVGFDRIYENTWGDVQRGKVRFAKGREEESILKHGFESSIIGRHSVGVRRRRKFSGKAETREAKIIKQGTNFKLKWVKD